MSDELVFYTHPMSRARVVRWMLEEVGRPYETKILEFGHSMKAPEYLAINPMGKVPAGSPPLSMLTGTAPAAVVSVADHALYEAPEMKVEAPETMTLLPVGVKGDAEHSAMRAQLYVSVAGSTVEVTPRIAM